MSHDNLLYAHSGGVTAVINASAAAVIAAARASGRVGKVLAAHRGIGHRLIDAQYRDLSLRGGGFDGATDR